MKKHLRFYIIKLFLLVIIALCATLVAFLCKSIIVPFESLMYRVLRNGIPMLFFMYFMYTVESRIKVPENKEKLTGKYFFLFSLHELSVYVIFLIPMHVLYIRDSMFIYGDGFLSLFYEPHALFYHILRGLPTIVNTLIPAIIFGGVACLAHYNKSKRPAPVPSVDELAGNGAYDDDDGDVDNSKAESSDSEE